MVMKIRAGLIGFMIVVQSVFFLTHLLLYETWTSSLPANGTPEPLWLKLLLGILSVSFLFASLLAWRYTGKLVRAIYKVAAVWLGLLSFLFIAAVFSWLVFALAWAAGWNLNFHVLVEALFGMAVATGIYGVFNANCTRITRTTVRLANLPEA